MTVFFTCVAGRLLDATKVYMYVFLLAGCEVVLSAVVLCVCNLLFIKKKPEQPDSSNKMEMAETETERELLNKAPQDDQISDPTSKTDLTEEQSQQAASDPQVAGQTQSQREQDKSMASTEEQGGELDSVIPTKVNGNMVEPESSL